MFERRETSEVSRFSSAQWLIGLIAQLLHCFPCISREVKLLFTQAPIQLIVNQNKTIMKYYNLFQQQWYTQNLVDAFNADEALWKELEIRRKLRRRVCSLREEEYKALELLEFEATRPLDDCIGIQIVS